MHYGDVIISAVASQIISLTIVYSTVYSEADQRKHQSSSASLAFVWGIHRGPVNSPHKWPVTREIFPLDDSIMDRTIKFDNILPLYSRLVFTHWGRATHICVSKLTIIASDNGLSPGRHQAIIWNNAGIFSIGLLRTNFSEILIAMLTFALWTRSSLF